MIILNYELADHKIECTLSMKINDELSFELSGSEDEFTLDYVDSLQKNTRSNLNPKTPLSASEENNEVLF